VQDTPNLLPEGRLKVDSNSNLTLAITDSMFITQFSKTEPFKNNSSLVALFIDIRTNMTNLTKLEEFYEISLNACLDEINQSYV